MPLMLRRVVRANKLPSHPLRSPHAGLSSGKLSRSARFAAMYTAASVRTEMQLSNSGSHSLHRSAFCLPPTPAPSASVPALPPKSPMLFACSHCHMSLQAEPLMAGHHVNCPGCGERITVPKETAPPAAGTESPKAERERKRGGLAGGGSLQCQHMAQPRSRAHWNGGSRRYALQPCAIPWSGASTSQVAG